MHSEVHSYAAADRLKLSMNGFWSSGCNRLIYKTQRPAGVFLQSKVWVSVQQTKFIDRYVHSSEIFLIPWIFGGLDRADPIYTAKNNYGDKNFKIGPLGLHSKCVCGKCG